MDRNQFLEACNLLKTGLINQVMDRTYNSVGSNIFFEFGKQKEIVFQNGKKHLQKEWSIWLSWTSWRISQHNKYVIGSGENSDINIQTHLESLLGKRILSFRFLSQFLDLEICFEDGYEVTTFFNRIEENQWLLFFPNDTEIVIDCSSEKAIESVKHLSRQIEIKNKYKKIKFPFVDEVAKQLLFAENKLSKIILTEGFSIDLGLSAWRLEKNGQYQMGRKDYYFGSIEGQSDEFEDKLLDLVGKKIKSMSMNFSGMDLRLEFEDGYIFEIFTHSKVEPWKIYSKNEIVLHAKLENAEN
ncbi:MAG: hypothetical protein Q8L98_03595 [Chlamydiales bacterium]|nr:hypothetical protein [Chlamydiales bacterium]